METSGGIRASLAGRYASALFDLARDERQIEAVANSLETLSQALADSKDFSELVGSPLVSRDAAGKAFAALGPQLSLDPITANFLGVPARPGRTGQVGRVRGASRRPAADLGGATTADVTTARPLADDQIAALKSKLKARVGSDVIIDARVDPKLLGGIVVRLGSQMIDASIATKLNTLATAMKG